MNTLSTVRPPVALCSLLLCSLSLWYQQRTHVTGAVLMTRGFMAVDTRIHALVVLLNAIMIADVNIVSRRYWGAVSSTKQLQRSKLSECIARIFQRNDRCAVDVVSGPEQSFTERWTSSCEIMKCPAMNAAFAAHVEKYVVIEHNQLCVFDAC
jgi:hypothetical protein